MLPGPRLPAGVDDPLPQQQFRQPVPRPHQIPAAVLTGPHQIPRRFLLDAGNRHLHDLTQPQQPGQMLRITGVGLDPIPGRALQLRRCRHHAPTPAAGGTEPDPNPVGPASYTTATGPGSDCSQARISSMTGLNRRSNSSPVTGPNRTPPPIVRAHPAQHSYAELHWGLPRLWLYRQDHFLGNPRSCERGPSPPYGLEGLASWSYDNNFTGWNAVLGECRGTADVPARAAPARLTDFAGLAPAFIDVGELDIYRDECILYARNLSLAGVSTELYVRPGVPHGFDRINIEIARRSWADRYRAIQAL